MPNPDRKIFLTMDTDWCPEEVLQFALALLQKHALPCTIFATGRYAALENRDPTRIEIGLHPNFNEAKLAQYESKLNELLALYPHALGVASHAMMSSTPLLELFKRAGLQYDRNLLFYKQTQARAFYHYNGLLRLPIFWEDDIWFSHEPEVPFAAAPLLEERFHYLYNFHPVHLYLNTASAAHYASCKPYYRDPAKLREVRHAGYGVHSYFMDLIEFIAAQNIATGLLHELLS
ncbi:hypothetical protein HUU05_18045 [candidate division KSB1 bacterium]|nr:hypothetical protein [candidate division KSB1 bacterium]